MLQLDLSDDQTLFQETTARFIETELPLASTRALHEVADGFDRSWLQKSAELGWFAMLTPEADGGGSVSGSGLLDAVIVAEMIGRHVQPGPFVPMNVVADVLAREAKGEARTVLQGISAGEITATWAFADLHGNLDAGRGVKVTRNGDEFSIDGSRGAVQDAGIADVVLVLAQLDGVPAHVLLPRQAIDFTPLQGLDLSRRFTDVSFNNVTVVADSVMPATDHSRALQVAIALNLADTVGAMDVLFDMTVAYAQDRIAFGRPIGSFQALKHVIADQALGLEKAKAAAMATARAVQSEADNADEVVSMASVVVAEAGYELAQECLQVFGGIGYTWEHDLHLFMRRIQSNLVLYGDATWYRERVCAFHGLGAAE